MSLIQAKQLLSLLLDGPQRADATETLLAIPGSLLSKHLAELQVFLYESNNIGQEHRFFRSESVSSKPEPSAQTSNFRPA